MKSVIFQRCPRAVVSLLFLPAFCFSQGQGQNTSQMSPDLADYVRANAANPSAIIGVIMQFAVPPTQGEIANINAAANSNANSNGNPNPGPPQPLPGAPDLSLIG